MRPKGIVQQLAARRKRALQWLKKKGRKVTEVARSLGVTPRSVPRWRHDERRPQTRRKNKRPPGRPRRLTERQMARLEKVLLDGAFAQGYAEDYWTLDRIAHVIWDLGIVRCSLSSQFRLACDAANGVELPETSARVISVR